MTKLNALPTSEAMLGLGSSGHQPALVVQCRVLRCHPHFGGQFYLDYSLDLQLGLHIMVSLWFLMGAKTLFTPFE